MDGEQNSKVIIPIIIYKIPKPTKLFRIEKIFMDLDASLWYWEYISIYFIFTENYTILWRNMFGTISFVSGHGLRIGLDGDIFEWWSNIRIYSVCTAKFLIFLEGGGMYQDLF